MKYRCLTLSQPWATLVAIGAKKIETRSWSTTYRGQLLIHAGIRYPDRGLRFEEPFYSALWRAGIKPDMPLPTGAILASSELFDCVPTRQSWKGDDAPWFVATHGETHYKVPPPHGDDEHAFGDYSEERWAWLLADVRELPAPIPARGALGLWTWNGALPP